MKNKIYLIIFLFFFPVFGFSQQTDSAETLRQSKEYQNTLSIFKEQEIMPTLDAEIEVYRVFITPTFYHPLLFKIEKSQDKYFLVAKQLSGKGGYGWGNLKREKKREISVGEWQKLLDLLKQASFWTLEAKDKKNEPNEKGEVTICLDGTSWFLEGVSNGKYQAVERYCPESKKFETVGLYLLKLSKWKIKESEVL